MRLALLFLVGVVAGCALPVRVQNTPERPVPTAPMGVVVEDRMNPQLGAPPSPAVYDEPSFDWGGVFRNAITGNWIGVAGTVVASIAGGAAVHQRRQRSKEARERLAGMKQSEG